MKPIFVYDKSGKLVRILNPAFSNGEYKGYYTVYKKDDPTGFFTYENMVYGNEEALKKHAENTTPNFGKTGPETEVNIFNAKKNNYDKILVEKDGSLRIASSSKDKELFSKPNLEKTYINGPKDPIKPVTPVQKPVTPVVTPPSQPTTNNQKANVTNNMKQFFIYNPQGIAMMVFSKDANGNYQISKTNDKGVPIDNQVETLDAATFEKRLADSYTIGAYTDDPDLDRKATAASNPSVLNPVTQTPSTNSTNDNAAPVTTPTVQDSDATSDSDKELFEIFNQGTPLYHLIDKDKRMKHNFRKKPDGTYRIYLKNNDYSVYDDVSEDDMKNFILEKEKEGFMTPIPTRDKLFPPDAELSTSKIGTKDKNEIIALQTALGMPEKDRDGKMGPKTKQYIEDYQDKNKLKKDGIAGKLTIEHLEKNVATTPAVPTTATTTTPTPAVKMDRKTPEGLKAIQRYLGVPETGVEDAATLDAVKKYQTDNKLKVDGKAGALTVADMEKKPRNTTAPSAPTTPTIATPPSNQANQAPFDFLPFLKNNQYPIPPNTAPHDPKQPPTTTVATDANGKPVVTPTNTSTDINNDGVIDEKDVVFTETATPEIATSVESPFTRRVTHGIWEPFGESEDGLIETRTRPIKRIYTNPQRQDTSTATVVNEFLGSRGMRRENRNDRRYNADNARTRGSNDYYENDDLESDDDSRNDRGGRRNNEKVLEGKEGRVRRTGPLIQNPMIDLAKEVVKDPSGTVPDFDNVRDARQFHRAVRQAQTFLKREDNAIGREKNREQKQKDRIAAIRQRTAERLGRAIPTPDSSPQGTSTTPTTTPIIGDATTAPKQYAPLVENSVNDYNKSLMPSYNFQGQGTINNSELLPEIQTKQYGGRIMQIGGDTPKPLFGFKMPKQNNANWKFDGLDELSEYKIKDDAVDGLLKNKFQTTSGRGQESQLVNTNKNGNTQSVINNQLGIKPPGSNSKFGIVADPINFVVGHDGSKQTAKEGSNEPYWNSRKLNVFGNQMQHEANMYPVMDNVGKSLFDRAEVQNPIYNKQDVAYLQGMKRNQIAPNMNVLNDNREAMNQAIRGNARGSGQILNAYAANQNASNRSMNDEMYRIKNANQAQENNYLAALNQIGSNRREIDTLVDEKNRQHRLSFEKFQRDALESGEKAMINKGQMLNQELADKITMDNYLNQIGKNFKYKLQPNGTYLVEFEDFTGNKKTMDPRQTKATMEIMQKAEQDKLSANQAAANAQAGSDAKAQALAAENTEKLKLQAIEEQRKLEAQQEARKQAELQRLADEAAKKKASGKTNKTGGYIYKRKSF